MKLTAGVLALSLFQTAYDQRFPIRPIPPIPLPDNSKERPFPAPQNPDEYKSLEYRMDTKSVRNKCVIIRNYTYRDGIKITGKGVSCTYSDDDDSLLTTFTFNDRFTRAQLFDKEYIVIGDDDRTTYIDGNSHRKHIRSTDPKAVELTEKHNAAEQRIIRPEFFYNGYRF